jgi:hypothetical protein
MLITYIWAVIPYNIFRLVTPDRQIMRSPLKIVNTAAERVADRDPFGKPTDPIGEYRTRNYELRSSENPKKSHSLSLEHSELLVQYSIFRILASGHVCKCAPIFGVWAGSRYAGTFTTSVH